MNCEIEILRPPITAQNMIARQAIEWECSKHRIAVRCVQDGHVEREICGYEYKLERIKPCNAGSQKSPNPPEVLNVQLLTTVIVNHRATQDKTASC